MNHLKFKDEHKQQIDIKKKHRHRSRRSMDKSGKARNCTDQAERARNSFGQLVKTKALFVCVFINNSFKSDFRNKHILHFFWDR